MCRCICINAKNLLKSGFYGIRRAHAASANKDFAGMYMQISMRMQTYEDFGTLRSQVYISAL